MILIHDVNIGELIETLSKFTLERAASTNKNQRTEVYIKDWLNLRKLKFNIQLDRLSKQVPSELIMQKSLIDSEAFPEQYLFALNAASEVSHDTARRCFNHYITLVSGNMNYVFRESFIIKLTLTQDKDLGMEWVAKTKDWALPWNTRLKDKKNALLADLANEDQVITLEALDMLKVSAEDVSKREYQNLFKNYPHDLFIRLPFEGVGSNIAERITFHSDKKSFERKSLKDGYARLQAPSKYKWQFLNAMLEPSDVAELSRPSFIIEGLFKQNLTICENDIQVVLSPAEWKMYLSQPVNVHPGVYAKGEVKRPFDNFIAIDLNEREVGYAVFNLKTGDVIDSGTKRMPTLAKLTTMSQKGRKNREPKQKYSQNFSNKSSMMREKALGEIKFFVNNLMDQHTAFPVFESHFNGGGASKEAELVFNNVLNLYTFSNVSAHKQKRKSFWLGAQMWEHPYAKMPEKVEKKGRWVEKRDRSGNIVYKPLRLFPGTTVNPYGTSQTCACCGVNPIDEIKRYFSEPKNEFAFVDDSGVFELCDGLRLKVEKRFAFDDLPEEEAKELKRRNRRSPWGKKYRAGKYKESELLRMVREHIRRPHDNLRSKGSAQSQYHCANISCQKHISSDENAAINIGNKFLLQVNLNNDNNSDE